MIMRIHVVLCLFMACVMVCTGCSAPKHDMNTFVSSANGHTAPISVEVRINDDRIDSVEIISQDETVGMTQVALERIPRQIVEYQSLVVDSVAGCTITCNAIINAVSDALDQAGVDKAPFLIAPVKDASQKRETMEYAQDVVVIGAGAAGLSAAMSAADAGCSVLVIEKMSVAGGNTLVCGGTFNVVEPERQQRQGISDSVELFIKNTYEGGLCEGNMLLITKMCEDAYDSFQWLIDNGTSFKPESYLTIGGMWPRSIDMDGDCYTQFIKPFEESLTKKGVTLLKEVKATELILTEGSVTGVLAQGTTDGRLYSIKAKRGVILATGGFSQNKTMLERYAPDKARVAQPNGWVTSTGDGIAMALEAGANLTDMSFVQVIPGTPEGEYAFNNKIENTIFINLDAKRFANEQSRRDELTNALMAQPKQTMYILFDSQTIDESFSSARDRVSNYLDYRKLAKEGKCYYGETLDDLAVAIGVDSSALKETVDQYNKIVDGVISDPYGRELFYRKIGQSPYYATKKVPRIHYTMGGVEIDVHARVISSTGEAIPGLYAAGEVTGGIHGANRLGGNSLVDCVVFGRTAGNECAGRY